MNSRLAFVILLSIFVNAEAGSFFTALDIDNHPCTPENLKRTNRYICDGDGNVICQAGWREPDVREALHALNPCLEPICEINDLGCIHGECRAPNYCACEVGWEGPNCNKCVRLPGCDHGTCTNAFDCTCEDGWAGAYCNIAQCEDCANGNCVAPGECVCLDGWTGQNCDQCQEMPGCQHGSCLDRPHTCNCYPGWEGHLCDKHSCNPPCVHGYCHGEDVDNSHETYCVCQNGWRDDACDKCRPYWLCPNQGNDACNMPNECICPTNNENSPFCNNTDLIRGGGGSQFQTGDQKVVFLGDKTVNLIQLEEKK